MLPIGSNHMKNKLVVLNPLTGEQLDLKISTSGQHRPTIYGDRWLQMSQDASIQLAKDRDLWGRNRAILDYLLGVLNFENFIQVPHKIIAEELNLARPSVTKGINLLVKKDILIKHTDSSRTVSYRLNPNFGWKGDNKKARDFQLELIKGGKTSNE